MMNVTPQGKSQEEIINALDAWRIESEIHLTMKDGSTLTGKLVYNPFKDSGNIVNGEGEERSSIAFLAQDVSDFKPPE